MGREGEIMERLMTVKEVAKYLKLNHMTVYRYAQKRKIPAVKIGGSWRFKKSLLDEWLERNRRDLQLLQAPKERGKTHTTKILSN